ncbi:MAG: NDP-sugar synthase [Beijerinckiaceae bacterium]
MTGASEYPVLHGGIIAAGAGTRLRADGYHVGKPMAPVGGRPLIDYALDRFRAAGIRRVTIILNEASDDCRRWLNDYGQDFDLDVIVRTTPSSYASFQFVAARLAHAPTVITTIDAIMPVDDFRLFVKSAAGFAKDAVVLGLTAHVDDENPLWATLNVADGRIRALGGEGGSHVTAGLYWLPAPRPAEPPTGFPRLRDYLKWLVEEHREVYGVVLPVVFDIDRARDVQAAELAEFRRQRESAGE